MKKFEIFFWLSLVLSTSFLCAQSVEPLGLENKRITSLRIGEGVIAVGTNSNGVYWNNLFNLNDSTWKHIDVPGANVQTVYPHKSGPIGWAIGIGAEPNLDNSEYIFCSFLGGEVRKMSYGILAEESPAISVIDGFPDPTICGETFAIGGKVLYRRYFNDTVWQPIHHLTIEGIFASLKARTENAYVYAGGADGYAGMLLMRSSDKGDTWENLSPMCYVADVDFWGDADHKIFVTDHQKILRSLDNGANWKNVFSDDSLSIQKISFSKNGAAFYAVANTRYYDLPRTFLLETSDNGETWTKEQLPIYDIVVGLEIDADFSVYLASISSGVFKIKPLIIKVEEEKNNLPDEFMLAQNYPNPFNPETIIKWQLPAAGFVTLKVYDVLGREVKTVLQEYKPAGSYSTRFDAGSLPTGIYFYRLSAGAFFKTMRMTVLK